MLYLSFIQFFYVFVFILLLNCVLAKKPFAITTFLNSPYKPLLQNFIKNLSDLNLLDFLHVFVSDDKLDDVLLVNNVNFTKLESIETSNKDSSYGENFYWYISKQKTRAFLESSLNFESFIFADTDVFFLNNPLSDLKYRCNFSICFQSNTPNGYLTINSGFFFVKNSSKTEHFFKLSSDFSKGNAFEKLGDQDILNFIIEKYSCYRPKVFFDFLDLENYPNGSNQSLWSKNCSYLKEKDPKIYILHNNWLKGLNNKINRFKSINAWYN